MRFYPSPLLLQNQTQKEQTKYLHDFEHVSFFYERKTK